MELVTDRVRCKVDPERWPIPGALSVGSPRTDFTQLIHCPEFIPWPGLHPIYCWLVMTITLHCWLVMTITLHCWLVRTIRLLNCSLVRTTRLHCWLVRRTIRLHCWLRRTSGCVDATAAQVGSKRFSSHLIGGPLDPEVRQSPPGSAAPADLAAPTDLATPTPDVPAPDPDAWIQVEKRQRQPPGRNKVLPGHMTSAPPPLPAPPLYV